MRTEEAVDRLLAGLERLEGRLARIEGRLESLEGGVLAPQPAPPAPAESEPAAAAEERPDPFQPAISRASASRHLQAVNRALSMLGLTPERPEEEVERRRDESARHKAAVGHALEALRASRAPQERPITPAPEPPGGAVPPSPAEPPAVPEEDAEPALELAREVALPDAAALDEEPVIPPPDVAADVREKAARAARAESSTTVDLGAALEIDLERSSRGVRDLAAPILNALVLMAAAGGALYYGGAITQTGFARDAWPEILAGIFAVGCGAGAWFWRAGSLHLRALLAGAATLLFNGLLLVLLPRLLFPDVLNAIACGLAALLGLRLVLETRHPLAVFLGFGMALLLPHWLAPREELRLPFVAAINVATAVGAVRLHRLQASVAAAALTVPYLYAARGPMAAPCGAICAATYMAQALLAPAVLRRRSFSAALLALAAFAFASWTVHVLFAGPGWLKAALLFAVAAAAAIVAVRLPVRQELLRAVFKAGSLLVLLAALLAGLETGSLAPSTLFLALLFAVFALVLRDPFLRAAGALMLVATIGLFYREGPSAPLLLAASAVSAALFAARPDGMGSRTLEPLLGGAAHGLLLFGLERVVPGAWLVYVWLATALLMQGAAWRFPLAFLEAGTAIAAGAAAIRAFALPVDFVPLGVAAATLVPLAVLARDGRVRGLYLLAAELLAIAAVAVAWPGPMGVLATLPLLVLLAVPWPRAPHATLRAHARFLSLVLLARCLAPDVLFAGDVLRTTAAMGACFVAGQVAARYGRAVRLAALLLASSVAGAWVYARTRREDWACAAAAIALAAGFCAALVAHGRPPAEEELEVETVPAEGESYAEDPVVTAEAPAE